VTGFCRRPGCRQRRVQCATFLVGQVVTFVVGDEIDHCPVGQCRRLIKDEATFLDASSQRPHATTVRLAVRHGNRGLAARRRRARASRLFGSNWRALGTPVQAAESQRYPSGPNFLSTCATLFCNRSMCTSRSPRYDALTCCSFFCSSIRNATPLASR